MPIKSDYSDGVPVIGYCLADRTGRVLAERNADTRFYSASTIKLGVLIAVVQAVERGELALDQSVVAATTFNSGAGGRFSFDPEDVDAAMPAAGTALPLHEVLARMVSASSNEATNMAVELVGFDAVNAALQRCGAPDARMERLIGDLEARDAGLTHEVSARDLAMVMGAILSGAVAGPELTALMLQWLSAQEHPVIGAELDATSGGAVWGSKSGWVTGIHHDVAYVLPPGAHDGAGYLLAVCTRGFAEQDAAEAIRAVAAFAWELYRAQG